MSKRIKRARKLLKRNLKLPKQFSKPGFGSEGADIVITERTPLWADGSLSNPVDKVINPAIKIVRKKRM